MMLQMAFHMRPRKVSGEDISNMMRIDWVNGAFSALNDIPSDGGGIGVLTYIGCRVPTVPIQFCRIRIIWENLLYKDWSK